MTTYARVAPTEGTRITDETTCTIGTATVAVPLRTEVGGRIATHRLWAALETLGYRPDGAIIDSIVNHGDWFEIAVVPLDGAS